MMANANALIDAALTRASGTDDPESALTMLGRRGNRAAPPKRLEMVGFSAACHSNICYGSRRTGCRREMPVPHDLFLLCSADRAIFGWN